MTKRGTKRGPRGTARRPPRNAPASERPLALVAALAAAAVALGGLLLCEAVTAAGWFAADVGSFGAAMRVGVLGWLVGNGGGLAGGGFTIGAVPLGFLLLAGYALYRTGRWAVATSAPASPRKLGFAVAAATAAYASVGLVAAAATSIGSVHAPLSRVAVAYVALPLVFASAGLLRGSGLVGGLVGRLPEEVRAALHGGVVAALAMLAISALALGASLVAHLSTALTLADGARAGVVGGLVLALIGAALVPNATLCAGAFLAGPGFAVGAGTSVSPGGIRVGLLPDFPLLAAIPTSADAAWLPALIVLPVIAGGVGGVLAARRYPAFRMDQVALRGALAGLAGGVLFGLATVAATGSVGPGRLGQVGPDVLATTAVCAIAFLLGGLVAAVGARWLAGAFAGVRRRTRPLTEVLHRPTRPDDADPPDTPEAADAEVTQPLRLGGVADLD